MCKKPFAPSTQSEHFHRAQPTCISNIFRRTPLNMRLLLLWCLALHLGSARCAHILAVLPLNARSHHVFFQAVLSTLAQRGHQVTVYSAFPQPQPPPNYTDIFLDLPNTNEKGWDEAFWDFVQSSQLAIEKVIWKTVEPKLDALFIQESILKMMNSSEKYDLVVTQALVGQESVLAFGHKFRAPTIVLNPKTTSTVESWISGNSLSISHVPDVGLSYSSRMTFWERLLNAYSKLSLLYYYYSTHLPRQEALMRRHFQDPTLPPLLDMVNNISLIFNLGHKTALYPQPGTPNIVPLGGIHVEKRRKPLPQDVQIFMDGAKDGVIYFSLGTYVPDNTMGRDYFQNYINVFKNLTQRVLWKTRMENLEDLPENVMIAKWMPQQDILAHPNCVLFITHGGLLSQQEAMYFGVPVVGVAYFADQPMNVRFYQYRGLGICLNYKELTEESIRNAVTSTLNDPRYRENAARLSNIFRDEQVTAEESVVFWTEYVLRHKGAGHLLSAASLLPWYQRALLDVFVAVLAIIILLLTVLYLSCRWVCAVISKRQYVLLKQIKLKSS